MNHQPVYRCPHCDAVIDHVTVTETVPLFTDDGHNKRHPVNAARRAAVASAHHRGGVRAVMAELGVSRSQAYRLVGQANSEP